MKDKNLEFIDYYHNKKNSVYINSIVSKKISDLFSNIKKDIQNKKKTLNILNDNFNLNSKLSEIKKFKKYKTVAIIGMGGSILGTEAIHSFLKNKIKKKIYFFNNINEKKILDFKKKVNSYNVLFIVISKSGNTTETISNTFSLGFLKKNSKNVIIITERNNNFLYSLAKKYNLYFVEHKKFIGGRFSVLSETGLIPSYLMDLNIKSLRSKLLDEFKKKNELVLKEKFTNLFSMFNSKKYNNLIFLNYSPELDKFLLWLQQLIAESLGKNGKGFLPVISSMPKDHHSLLQLYLDGPKDKFFYIFHVKKKPKIKVNLKNSKKDQSFLNGKFLENIKKAQKNALIKTLIRKKIPFREFRVKHLNEETIGKFFAYFILETIVLGKLSKINPYDQPAVEQVKLLTKNILIKSTKKNF